MLRPPDRPIELRTMMTRRGLLKGILGTAAAVPLAGLLAACGSDDSDETGSQAAASGNTATPESQATEESTDAATTPTSADSSASQRIVALGYVDELLALGVTPVAAGVTYAGVWYPHLEDQLQGVAEVGKWFEPNVEAILAAEPDLIIAFDSLKADYGEQLEAIAPTEYITFTELGGADGVEENLTNVAKILGLEDLAEQLIQEHRQKIEDARTQISEVIADQTVAFLRVLAKEYRLVTVGPGYAASVLYGDLGLTPPPFVAQLEEEGYAVISLEVIPEIQADHMFFLAEDEDTLTELSDSPLWQNSPAVQNGNVYQVNDITWQTTAILADGVKIDDVVSALVGSPSATQTGNQA